MAKEHKYHNSAVVIQTSLSPEQALNIAKEVVDSQREVHLSDLYSDGFSVVVKAPFGNVILHFLVTAKPNDWGTELSTYIVEYNTSVNTFLLIPIGPKTMDGYGSYRRYMNGLVQVVSAADPTSLAKITERTAA